MPRPCFHLVDAQHRCAKLLTQAMERRRHCQHLFGPLHPISRLKLAPQQSRQRVNHQQAHCTPGQEEGHTSGEAHLERVLQSDSGGQRVSLWVETPSRGQAIQGVGKLQPWGKMQLV